MFTENNPRLRIAVPVALPSLVQNSSMQGCSETDVSELMVAPKSSPLHSVAMTATPVGKAPMTDRKCLGSMAHRAEPGFGFLALEMMIACAHVTMVSARPVVGAVMTLLRHSHRVTFAACDS